MLQKAVADFERAFAKVDDFYLHGGQSRTDEGWKFNKLTVGANYTDRGVTFTPCTDHLKAIAQWRERAFATITSDSLDYLAWSIRPHFVAVEGGFILESGFIISKVSLLDDKTKERHTREDQAAK